MYKILFCYPHGLGDLVLATPALKIYKDNNPDTVIHIAVMKKHSTLANELLSGLYFIDDVIPCLSNPWDDFPGGYRQGLQEVYEEAKKLSGYDQYILVPTARYGTDIEGMHKIFRVAKEIGVKFEYLEDLQTQLVCTEEAEQRVEEYIKDLDKPIMVLHTQAGNAPKTLMPPMCEKILTQYQYFTVLEFGRKSTDRSIIVQEDDMEFSKALIKRADLIIAIDSAVMHIAGAFKRPVVGIFTMTPVHQAIPLSYRADIAGRDTEVTEIAKWNEYKKELYDKYPPNDKITYDDRWYFEGGSSIYQGYWFGERSAMGIRIGNRLQSYIDSFPDAFDNCNVLDVGCAAGYFVKYLRDYDIEAYGCDPSNWIINREETLMTPYKQFLKVGTAQDMPFDRTFDTVIAADILEHLTTEEFNSFLQELNRIEAKNLIVKVPTKDDESAHNDKGHILIETKEWWVEQFQIIGFDYVDSLTYLGETTWLFQKGVEYEDEVALREFIAKSYQPVPFAGYEDITKDALASCQKRWLSLFPLISSVTKPLKVLDIGCNLGYFSFLTAGLGHNVTAIDNNWEYIHYVKYLSNKEKINNIEFNLLNVDLLDYLKKYDNDQFDITYYMGVHHHIYEYYNSDIADEILYEISRISTDMIFSMGQPDEEGNKYTAWKGLIPKFDTLNIVNDIADHVIINSDFIYNDIVCSHIIHGTHRYVFGFTKDEPELPKIIRFRSKGFIVDEYLWMSNNRSDGRLESSDRGFPLKRDYKKNRAHYYIVHDYTGKKFFVKEILYDPEKKKSPNELAQEEFERGMKLPDLKPFVLAALSFEGNKLLYDYCDWDKLIDIDPPSTHIMHNIVNMATQIQMRLGDFDFSMNNIFYNNNRFKFFDFEPVENVVFNHRVGVIMSYFLDKEDK